MDKNIRRTELFTNAMSNLLENKFGMSIDLLNEILAADPDDKLALLARGTAYMKMGNPQKAENDFSRVLERDAAHQRAFHLRGLARESQGDDDEALHDFDRAIEIDPEYGAAYYSRASLLTKMGREDAAADDIQMIAHLTGANIESFANENNVWRSRQLQVESILESEMHR